MKSVSIKDSIIQDMKLGRLYGKREAIEAHLALFQEGSEIHKTLQKNLDHVNREIMMFRSDE